VALFDTKYQLWGGVSKQRSLVAPTVSYIHLRISYYTTLHFKLISVTLKAEDTKVLREKKKSVTESGFYFEISLNLVPGSSFL
jgi:hypothetical protein